MRIAARSGITIVLVLLAGWWFYENFYPKIEIKCVTEFTPAQVSAIQKEFGFALPEGANIVLGRYANSKDRQFTIVITGAINIKEFIANNLEFEAKDTGGTSHSPYDPSAKKITTLNARR